MEPDRSQTEGTWRARAFKLLGAALFVYATGGPALVAREGDSQTFFIEQRALTEQKKAQEQEMRSRRNAHDFVPAETTRTREAGRAAVEPTFFVDVIGDSLAYLAAQGLAQAFADHPEILVNDKARDSSGLVRDDYYDWLKAARDLVAAPGRIDYVVVQVGINDLQPIKDGATSVDALSDRWREIYSQRIRALAEIFHEAHIPVLWVGLPPMRNPAFSAEVAKLNELFKESAEAGGAKYIDIWDAFTDENGAYSAFGPDIAGQNARLRTADDIRYTKAGARKAAQFLEGDVRRAFESAKPTNDFANLPPDIEQAAIDINAQIRHEMGVAPGPGPRIENDKPLAGPVLSLTSRPLSHGGALTTRAEISLAATALATGVEPDPKFGRADDFAWPRP